MATETLVSRTVNVLVANGTTSSGATKTANVSLGNMATTADAWDPDKAMAIKAALVKVLEKEVLGMHDIPKYIVASS